MERLVNYRWIWCRLSRQISRLTFTCEHVQFEWFRLLHLQPQIKREFRASFHQLTKFPTKIDRQTCLYGTFASMCNCFQNKSPTFIFAVDWDTCHVNRDAPIGSPRWGHCLQRQLAYEGLYFTDDIFKWIFLNKMYEFSLRFHWSLFLSFESTIFHHLFRSWLGAIQATSHYLNQRWLDYRCICVSRPQWVNSFHSWLTHWGRDKMDAISQTIFSNTFSWMKIFQLLSKFHWSLFARVILTIFQHWFAWTAPSHCLNQWWSVYRRIYASLGLNESMKLIPQELIICE